MAVAGITLILFFGYAAIIQYAESSTPKVTVVLSVKQGVKEFNVGQTVPLYGQIFYHTNTGGEGIPNVYYRIIDADTKDQILDGYARYDGTFEINWPATKYSAVPSRNLQAIFYGSGRYESAESNILALKIYGGVIPVVTYLNTQLSLQVVKGTGPEYVSINPSLTDSNGNKISTCNISIQVDGQIKDTACANAPYQIWTGFGPHTIQVLFPQTPVGNNIIYRESSDIKSFDLRPATTYYNTQLSLQVEKGSSPEYIQVYPALTYDSGTSLFLNNIQIHVDDMDKGNVNSNEWSADIWAGFGTHTIKAILLDSPDRNDNSIIYRGSSDTQYYDAGAVVQKPIVVPPTPPAPSDTSTLILVAIGIVVAAAAAIAIGLSKRRKSVQPIQTTTGKSTSSPVITPIHSDPTRFYGCPRCGKDTQIRYGKEYCDSCKVYL